MCIVIKYLVFTYPNMTGHCLQIMHQIRRRYHKHLGKVEKMSHDHSYVCLIFSLLARQHGHSQPIIYKMNRNKNLDSNELVTERFQIIMNCRTLFVFVISFLLQDVNSDHFNGGTIAWKVPDPSKNEVRKFALH